MVRNACLILVHILIQKTAGDENKFQLYDHETQNSTKYTLHKYVAKA